MTYYKKNGLTHELTKEAKLIEFSVQATVTAEQIEEIIVASLGGGRSYWCFIDNTTAEWDKAPKDLLASQFATQLLLEGKTVVLYDIFDNEERWGLTLQMLLNGIGAAISRGYNLTDYADEIIQLSLFGKLVYE